MENRDLFDLIERFEKSSLGVMELEQDGTRIYFEKEKKTPAIITEPVTTSQQIATPCSNVAESVKEKSPYTEVKAPLVGVFYSRPAPDTEPYVKEGDRVEKDQVLCLIEAMKMMNELKSPVSGEIVSVKGENGKAVEFDQVLFEVKEC